MNIPLFTREQFNEHLRANFDWIKIIPTDEAYDSYRHFVLNRYAPIGTGPQVIGSVETPEAETFITVELKKVA